MTDPHHRPGIAPAPGRRSRVILLGAFIFALALGLLVWSVLVGPRACSSWLSVKGGQPPVGRQ